MKGAALSAPHRIIDQQQTKRDREQVEETVIASHCDRDLQKDHQAAGDQSQSPRCPKEDRHDDFDDEAESDRKMLEPLWMLIGPPSDDCRQRLRPVVIIERGQIPPASVAAGQLHHAGHHHQFEKKELEQKKGGSGNRRLASAFRPKVPRREKDRQETGFEKENVPLKTEKSLASNGERKIKNEQRDERNDRRDFENQQ